ncbi:NlpC/P60 family protein [Streptomyces sp. NBC_01343]|uniref:C40 family peptidase n=1 Tax=Streptomyces sp. NBC_01343 TaxID=2903832 RepID=UPI002E0E5184|nr:NlpC/P60 family protein [Streptomyces sp. NBC_01343]
MSRRVLRAACIAALFVSAGPLPVTHAGSLTPADSATATARQPRATAGAPTHRAHGSADTTAPHATASTDTTARQGDSTSAPRAPGAGGAAAAQEPGSAGRDATGPGSTGPGSTGRDSTGATSRGLDPAGTADPQGTASPQATAPQGTSSPQATDPQGTAAQETALQGLGVGELLGVLQRLYREAEAAAEGYKATEVALKAGQDEERRLSAELAKARTALGAEKAAAGRVAREQYQGAVGISPYARMLLTGDPQAAQDQRRLAAREGARRAAVLARLTRGEHRADLLATAARKSLDAQQTLAAQRRRNKLQVDLKLKQVERILASLTPEQLARLGSREAADTATAQRELLDSGRLAATPRTPTAAGGAALTYATEQIGKPYVWGAEGPGSFDCSGLTSQAWAHAGRSIPRTSQEQWARLPKVPLDELRPGDLVVYFPTATHVALYVGDGKVIQAPRPGAKVKVSPIAANPLLGAVRPDSDATPLTAFTPPPLPKSPEGGDAGYSAARAPDPAGDPAGDPVAEAAEEAAEEATSSK